LRQGQLEQVTGARVKAVQVPSQNEEMLARRLKDSETRAAKKKSKALEKIQAEANRANSERVMQRFLGNRRIEPLEKGITPQGDG
jgi:myo-inositol-hexaphosphate 3-phosphohydrolase